MITLEQVDQMRKRTNCSYEEAKFFLEKHNGDVLEAIVDFEKSTKGTKASTNTGGKQANDFWQSIGGLIRKGFATRVVIEDNQKNNFMSVPVNVMLLLIIFASYLVIPALLIILLLGYRINIRKPKGETVDISSIVSDAAECPKNTSDTQAALEETSSGSERQPDNYNEITIE